MSEQTLAFHEATRERYLNYALSVITSRALPDVRDGLKPVQRRILYTMYSELGLRPDGRYRKSAAVVGEVMGKYHPHGDSSIYEALVRMAQPFSLRVPLVDGQGNFGSLDGDPPAAMRYTECKPQRIAEELLSELRKRTVDHRPTYDGQRMEPIVLPAQFPQLLVNGCEGIAVGMATRIPPHNLGEVVDAAVALATDRDLSNQALMQHIRGPDFPTGGQILADPGALQRMYEEGQGTFKVRATWREEKDGRKRLIIVDSVPYGQNKARILERIGAEIAAKRIPQLVDVRDESTDDVRVVLELTKDASAEAAMAWLFKHTPLETSWSLNMTALVPTSGEACSPARLDLRSVLLHWLDFRFETIRRRFAWDLEALRARIHILEGLEIIFDALDEAIAIIRASEGRRDAQERLINRFGLTDVQADAILDLQLYKLARLEVLVIREELEEKRQEADSIAAILASDRKLWSTVRKELTELRALYADARRTRIGGEALAYQEEAYIVREDTWVIVTREGWMRRQSSVSDISKIRVREGDEVGWLLRADTGSTLTLFTSGGGAYALRVSALPATTGHGEPVQASFQLGDGDRIVGVLSADPRNRLVGAPPADAETPPPPWAIAMTVGGRALRFPLAAHEEPSTRVGRRFARLDDGDRVLVVWPTDGTERACVATRGGRTLVFPVAEVGVLKAAGKGVTGIDLRDGDAVLAFELARDAVSGPRVVTMNGRAIDVTEKEFGMGARGNRGNVVLKRGSIDTWSRAPVVTAIPDPSLPPTEA